jgi:hypothetical protein
VKGMGEGFWVCPTGGCEYFSDRRDGIGPDDAKMRNDFDDFDPDLLMDISAFC